MKLEYIVEKSDTLFKYKEKKLEREIQREKYKEKKLDLESGKYRISLFKLNNIYPIYDCTLH